VVRLKGGDPFVFGRGREELEACLTAGVPVEVIPGVTSAISVPAAAGIPVTHRGLSQGFCVLAGHVRPGDPRSSVDWAALARSGMTLVLLMAIDHLAAIAGALMAAGLGADTPAAAISDGWSRRQRVVTATLADLAAAVSRAGVANPAVIVIGDVAELAAGPGYPAFGGPSPDQPGNGPDPAAPVTGGTAGPATAHAPGTATTQPTAAQPATASSATRAAAAPVTTHAAATCTIPAPRAAASPAPLPRRVLVLGGARSGKSQAAEEMLAGYGTVDYVATGTPPGAGDEEWDARVREHQRRRPAHWRTVETLALADVLAQTAAGEPDSAGPRPSAPVLVDCLTTWLARVMDDCGAWDGDAGAGAAVAARIDRLLGAWRQTRRHVVAVSNEIGSGVVPETASGRRFRDELGRLNARVAAASDEVWLCTAGIARRLR